MSDSTSTPNRPKEQVLKEATVDWKCLSCGGQRIFDPDTQKMKCEQCGALTELSAPESSSITEYDFATAEDKVDPEWNASTQVFHCSSCGADTVLGKMETSSRCSFCGSPHVADENALPGIRPESVVPFRVDRKQANEAFRVWLSKRFFAPAAVKKEYMQDHISGVYLPYWTYDAASSSSYTAQAGDYYYVTVTGMGSRNGRQVPVSRQERRIRWHPVSGDYSENFDDVLVAATTTIERNWLDKLEPFPLAALLPYRPDFLSGFSAERYGIGLKEGFTAAQAKMDARIRQGITQSIRADVVNITSVNTRFSDIKYKHLLLPLWISSYRYGTKTYRFLVNGHTEEVAGSYPVSVPKVLLAVLAGIAAVAVIYFFISRMTGY